MGGGARALVRQPKTAVFLQKLPKPGGSKSVKNTAGMPHIQIHMSILEIDRYGIFGADTDISAIHGLIADTDNRYSKILKSCFLLHYQKCYVFYVYLFFQKL